MAYNAIITRVKNVRPHPNADRYKNGERVRDIHKDYKHLVVYSTISDICSGNNWSCLKNK